jgi:hypothetical protein
MNGWSNTRRDYRKPQRTYNFGSNRCMTGIYGIKDKNILKLGYYFSGSYMRGIYSVYTLRNAIKN